MGGRVPVEHYDLSSAAAAAAAANSYIGTSLHDPSSGDDVADHAADDVTDDNDDRSSTVVSDCMREPYQSSLPLHNMGVEDERSSLENGSSCGPYSNLTIDDVSPIETARARFMDIVVNYFIDPHVIEMSDYDTDYMMQQSSQESKRKSKEIRYEGDANYALPLMYIANLYETLVNEVNTRLSSMSGIQEKTIGVALEAAGGLYRKLAKKFPRKGTCIFKRRELATSFETRSKFPELVIQEEKRVRFVVVNGLAIVEKPTKIGIDDAEWFKRLTGRNDVAVFARDYKFYAPRHKYRRGVSNSNSNLPCLPAFHSPENSSSMATSHGYRANEAQFHPIHQGHNNSINHSSHSTHYMLGQQCIPQPQLPEMIHNQQPSSTLNHIASLQSLGHVGGRLHVLPTSPAKFCDECGVPYLRETSKFCSECGTKRLGT
ncbi:uncharacterized protein At2g02148-like isoform X1 [Salvia splendens]|uniref:uncharacterized protein At2g02148-like isoform X1 n=2 Tax=Salvia splendens TaxID=180675 RepID=UPI001C25F0DE|nr:uncharacterized protein At2g02148-like isoform X1 [Salvia splendens]XP_042005165.1 uncharacterized protein At2g02148-like isoform X1 [Salvia splendens]